ncbi:MAG: HEAT repeat domain-containing protein [Bacteroidota bacterium]
MIAIGSIGLIVSKVRAATVETKLYSGDTKTREFLNQYLFADIVTDDSTTDREEFIKRLEPYLITLKIDLNIDGNSKYNSRRRSLKRVMLKLTTEVIGDTRIRLTRAFEYFDFVKETSETLRDNRWWIRAKGCKNAGLMMNESALPYLEQCLDDENGDVRIEAAQAMLDIAGVEILSPIMMRLKEMSPWMQVRLSRSILGFGEHSVLPLVQAMQSKYPKIQGFCVDMLGILGDVKAVPTLLEYIDYTVSEVKHKSLIALGRIGDGRSIPVIQRFLYSDNEQLRADAAKAAGNLSSPSMAYDLYWMLVKDTLIVKLAAAEALARSGELGIKSLLYALNLDDEQVRMIAMQFLHEAGVPMNSSKIAAGGV